MLKRKKSMKSKKKLLIKRVFQTFLVLGCMLLCIVAWHMYRMSHHGYPTSEKVILQYIKAWNNGNIYDMELCFNSDSLYYAELMQEMAASMNTQRIDMDYSDISIESTGLTDDESIERLKESTGLPDIDGIMMNMVSIPTVRLINGIEYDYRTDYYFQTYSINGKWFIDSFKLIGTVNLGRTDSGDIGYLAIGSRFLGYVNVPDTWMDNTETETTESLLGEISSVSPEKDAAITLSILDGSMSIDEIAAEICSELAAMDMIYVFDDNDSIGGIRCVSIANTDGFWFTKTYLFKNPLHDDYVHAIELRCMVADSDHYIDNCIRTYTLSN